MDSVQCCIKLPHHVLNRQPFAFKCFILMPSSEHVWSTSPSLFLFLFFSSVEGLAMNVVEEVNKQVHERRMTKKIDSACCTYAALLLGLKMFLRYALIKYYEEEWQGLCKDCLHKNHPQFHADLPNVIKCNFSLSLSSSFDTIVNDSSITINKLYPFGSWL